MQLPLATLPQIAPQRPDREPQANVPPTREQREYLFKVIAQYVADEKPVPPMPQDELRTRAATIIETTGVDPIFVDYVGVLINNEAWKEHLAPVPFERRLLLLPKCLRDEERCPAPFDEFGLLCKQCGLCSIQDLQEEAERLGYAVLTAEGSAIVMAIIETGKIDAIVGVSCLSVLEKAFPYMEAAAIPGVAIPLLQDDCKDTNLDIEWLWDMIHLTSEDQTRRLDLDSLRNEVDSWFTPESLNELLGPAKSHPEQVARDWLSRDGKRWRPFLAVCVWQAMQKEAKADRAGEADAAGEAASDPSPLRGRLGGGDEPCDGHSASYPHDDSESESQEKLNAESPSPNPSLKGGGPEGPSPAVKEDEDDEALLNARAEAIESFKATTADASDYSDIPLGLKKLAVAVECFHKASLIHDDIEDEDDVRYDEPTLHAEHGVPVALNVGDYMLGEGYRLIGECGAAATAMARMYQVAAEGHRQLSIGQGEELRWLSDPSPLDSLSVIEIFRRKTAPAFEVALKLGALFAWNGDDAAFNARSPVATDTESDSDNTHDDTNASDANKSEIPNPKSEIEVILDALHDYSEALGIAYQIKDDLDDFTGSIDSDDVEAMRLSICLAVAHERAKKDKKKLIASAWTKRGPLNGEAEQVRAICDELEVEQQAAHLHDVYKEQAVRHLRLLENANLKGLLRRVVGKIFDEIKIEGWCREHATGDAAGRAVSAEPVA